ncbi:MAG: alanine racemase [Anaerolineaceae bacterium]|nr:alanine racemase [Anaerolineaceae bacterium]
MSDHSYPTWLEVNLSAIESNTKAIITDVNLPLMAVVKANAYGLGSVEVARSALTAGASQLAVARFGEARVLREAGIQAPILVLGMVTPQEVDEAISLDVTLTMYSFDIARVFGERGKAAGKPVRAHLKVETGMSRLGVFAEEVLELSRFAFQEGIIVQGMYSHYAMADTTDHPLTAFQKDQFKRAVDILRENDLLPEFVHLANSAGTYFEKDAHYNLVRAGSAITGIYFRYDKPFPQTMRRVASLKTSLASCKTIPKGWGIGYGQHYITSKDELIGSVPFGYGDGFRRIPGNEMLIGGKRVPVVGTECMDQTMIKLPEAYEMGSEIVIFGQQGSEEITLEELAKKWKTVEVDVTTNINPRVPRVYIRD